MNPSYPNNNLTTTLSNAQVEQLQHQIRQFKQLGKKFTESSIPNLIETLLGSNGAAIESKFAGAIPKVESMPIAKPVDGSCEPPAGKGTATGLEENSHLTDSSKFLAVQKTVAHSHGSSLSWQCFDSLLYCHPQDLADDAAISQSGNSIGCFLKCAHPPLVLTAPFVSELREQFLSRTAVHASVPSADCDIHAASLKASKINGSDSGGDVKLVVSDNAQGAPTCKESTLLTPPLPMVWYRQRLLRAELLERRIQALSDLAPSKNGAEKEAVNIVDARSAATAQRLHPPVSLGGSCYTTELLPIRGPQHQSQHLRSRRQARRELKIWEKEERRRRLEAEAERRRRTHDFQRALVLHREEFFRFHKGRRLESAKIARAVRVQLETVDAKREKDEVRAEQRRLQALRENDMEAYSSLVQDTKNGRLKYLLNETDSYISTINRMIQEQRMMTPGEAEEASRAAAAAAVGAIASSGGPAGVTAAEAEAVPKKKLVETTKDYYRSTHRTVEQVRQPRMLKGGTLKEYQLTGLQWLVSLYNNNLNGILADEMGLGKTIQTIALICYLMEEKHNNGPFLIVVPLSTLSNWVNEFNRWAPDVMKVVYKGLPEERKRVFKEEVEGGQLNVLLTTYEFIMRDKASLKKLPWQYIIVDEGHRMKNAQSKFAQILGNLYQSKNRVLLTGTPLQNDLPELWSLLNFLLPTIFSSVETFDQWFNKPFAAFRSQQSAAQTSADNAEGGDGAGADALSQEERLLIVHRLHEVLRPFMLRRVKSQVLNQLPEKVEKVLRCPLSGWQRRMYQSIVRKGLASREKDGPGGGLNNILMQLRKACNHPFLFLRDYAVDEFLVRAAGKFALLDRMLPKLQAGGHRVLIFSQMVESMNFMEQFFLMRGMQFLRLDGNTSADERERRVTLFNAPDSPYFVFLLSTRAGGLGINLATADTVIIFDSDWNPSMDAQAQDRAHRIGQKKEVRVFRLLTNSPVEERILARASDKRTLTGLVVEAGKFNSHRGSAGGAAAQQENRALMSTLLDELSSGAGTSFKATTCEDAEGIDGGDLSAGFEAAERAEDELVNEMMAHDEEELRLYQRMDKEYAERRREHWAHMHQALAAAGAPLPPLPPRLMQAQERPPWLTEQCWPSKYVTVMHDMMGLKPLQPLKKEAKKKKGRRKSADVAREMMAQANAALGLDPSLGPGLAEGDSGGDDESRSDAEDSQAGAGGGNRLPVVAGKVMRRRKEVQYDDHMTDRQFGRFIERQQDEMQEEEQAVAQQKQQQRGRKRGPGAPPAIEKLEGTVYKDLLDLLLVLQSTKREDGAFLAALFVEKPPKSIYPDYYRVVAQPVSLKEVTARVRRMEYAFLEEMELDFALMSHNARTYNGHTSPVFDNSEAVRAEFYGLVAPVRAKYGLPASAAYVTPLMALPPRPGGAAAAGGAAPALQMPALPEDTHLIFGPSIGTEDFTAALVNSSDNPNTPPLTSLSRSGGGVAASAAGAGAGSKKRSRKMSPLAAEVGATTATAAAAAATGGAVSKSSAAPPAKRIRKAQPGQQQERQPPALSISLKRVNKPANNIDMGAVGAGAGAGFSGTHRHEHAPLPLQGTNSSGGASKLYLSLTLPPNATTTAAAAQHGQRPPQAAQVSAAPGQGSSSSGLSINLGALSSKQRQLATSSSNSSASAASGHPALDRQAGAGVGAGTGPTGNDALNVRLTYKK